MAVSIDGAGSVTGLDAVDVPVYADAAARDTAIASPTAGQIVFVTGTGSLVYNGTAWVALGAGAANFTNVATGTYTDGDDYKYITFTGIGELIVDRAGYADVFILSGGGGYHNVWAGGGNLDDQPGGTGVAVFGIQLLSEGTLTVVVGAGGTSNDYPWGTFGQPSSIGTTSSGLSRLYGMTDSATPVTSLITGTSKTYGAGGFSRPSSSGYGDGGSSGGQAGTAGVVIVRVVV
jgi:hypothetical protein